MLRIPFLTCFDVRADQIGKPGQITSQIIDKVIEADLVIADLTGQNANVFYELAIRHAIRKPVVKIIQEGDSIPFDVSQSRTIYVDHMSLPSADRCKKELNAQIKAIEEDPSDVDNPISTAVDLRAMRESGNPVEIGHAQILEKLEDIQMRLDAQASFPPPIEELPLAEILNEDFFRHRRSDITGNQLSFFPKTAKEGKLMQETLKHFRAHPELMKKYSEKNDALRKLDLRELGERIAASMSDKELENVNRTLGEQRQDDDQ